jgi:hypothetical protein
MRSKRGENPYAAPPGCMPRRTNGTGVTVTTSDREGIHTAHALPMIDFLTLLQRDHRDLLAGLDELIGAETVSQVRGALDGVRLGLTAHAEAEDIVFCGALLGARARGDIERFVEHARDAHLAQEGALASLVCTPPATARWRDHARHLRDMVHAHALYEEETIVPAIRAHVPEVYGSLAGRFATERLLQLAMLQPSAPIFVPELAFAS